MEQCANLAKQTERIYFWTYDSECQICHLKHDKGEIEEYTPTNTGEEEKKEEEKEEEDDDEGYDPDSRFISGKRNFGYGENIFYEN